MAIEQLTVEKCPCGHPACTTYGFKQGTFFQGTGFDKDEAELIAHRYNTYEEILQALEEELTWVPSLRTREKILGIIAKAKGKK